MRLRLLILLLTTATALAACGDDGGETVDAGDDPDTAVSSPPLSSVPDRIGGPWARIEPTEDLQDARVVPPDELVADPDDPDGVLVRFYGGVQECYGARATAEETDTEVRVTLEVGTLPDLPPDTACIEIAEAQELKLTLDAPLGDRDLVPVTR